MTQNSRMPLAGMFEELGPVRSGEPQPSVFDSLRAADPPDLADVVGYLKAGHVLIDVMGSVRDPFERSHRIIEGYTIMTDGDWLWRQSLAYFVERRNVALPDDFLSLIRDRGYEVPDRTHEELIGYTRIAHAQVF